MERAKVMWGGRGKIQCNNNCWNKAKEEIGRD